MNDLREKRKDMQIGKGRKNNGEIKSGRKTESEVMGLAQ